MGYLLRTSPDWDYLSWLRDNWAGPLIVKGVLNANHALAGAVLHFDVEVTDVRGATEEELAHGHAH